MKRLLKFGITGLIKSSKTNYAQIVVREHVFMDDVALEFRIRQTNLASVQLGN